jgi:SAM-dependent methyltransferase
MSPLCESFRTAEQLNQMEPFYPLLVRVCDRCFLVQLEEYVAPEAIFTEYAYFSSVSKSWLQHASTYAERMISLLRLDAHSRVVELGSNDGYLLRNFVERAIPVLGVEPAQNIAAFAREHGVPTLAVFFGVSAARDLVASDQQADLIVANNVLAQAPDLHDFVEGAQLLLKPNGTLTIEVPHLLRLVQGNQFDTIYHEHFSYFSLLTLERLLSAHGLTVFDVEELPTHGGSLRVYGRHQADAARPISQRVENLRAAERAAGLTELEFYTSFQEQVAETKRQLLDFLISAKRKNQSIVGYGAPGKGNTLLNYCGIRTDFLDYTVDLNPHKQGLFLPGTKIPIVHPDVILESRPDYILILPWNIKNEIIEQMERVRAWGCRFVVPIPSVEVV